MAAVQRALISVSDKTGVVDFCRQLARLGIALLSTGGTARLLAAEGLRVTEVSDYTGFPEIMDGRVKTLHPKIHGGLLARRGQDEAVMQAHGIAPIDLLVVNLYPFEATVGRPDCTLAEAVENIDIGGPAMLRAAAKNYAHVAAVVDAADYAKIIAELEENEQQLSAATRFYLAQKVFAHTANYEANISNYLGGMDDHARPMNYPLTYTMQFSRRQELRYGENPHQSAAFFAQPSAPAGTLASAAQLQGKALSYNNLADADAALECVLAFAAPACVIVKHANPCGAAMAENILAAYERAYASDPVAAFGGVIAFNETLDEQSAAAVIERHFVEVLIAPRVSAGARETCAGKPGLRVLEVGERGASLQQLELKRVSGGLLIQDADAGEVTEGALKVISRRAPSEQERADLLFAWRVVKYVKSNAIVFAKAARTLGIGAGQMSRIDSVRIATRKAAEAQLALDGAVMASDAFFPFRDGLDAAAEAGINAVIQPGGSVRDEEVIAAADEHGMAMVFTGMRHFRH